MEEKTTTTGKDRSPAAAQEAGAEITAREDASDTAAGMSALQSHR